MQTKTTFFNMQYSLIVISESTLVLTTLSGSVLVCGLTSRIDQLLEKRQRPILDGVYIQGIVNPLALPARVNQTSAFERGQMM